MADYELIALNESVPRLQAATSGDSYTVPAGAHLKLPSTNDAVTPTLSFGDGDSGIYESADDTLVFAFSGSGRWRMNTSNIESNFAGRVSLINQSPSSTVPVIIPNSSDANTGIGWNSADNLSLIAGGLEAIRAEDPADLAATETSLWLYDLDNAAIQQVTVGADDSGGAGFKVLRTAN